MRLLHVFVPHTSHVTFKAKQWRTLNVFADKDTMFHNSAFWQLYISSESAFMHFNASRQQELKWMEENINVCSEIWIGSNWKLSLHKENLTLNFFIVLFNPWISYTVCSNNFSQIMLTAIKHLNLYLPHLPFWVKTLLLFLLIWVKQCVTDMWTFE